jgi:2-keto-4-pentenoate hydratase/2-oxohepta-3-ene-1,7-dioic acid hydratase in catechol pathway
MNTAATFLNVVDVEATCWDGSGGLIWTLKGKDFGSSLGPVFVTPDELEGRRSGNGYDLEMISTVNGRRYGSDRWSSAYWSFEELISYASWNSRVEAGSIIGSGTCQGGCIAAAHEFTGWYAEDATVILPGFYLSARTRSVPAWPPLSPGR